MKDYTYKKRFVDNAGNYEIVQVRPGGNDRIIAEGHYAYQAFLDSGGVPEEIAYTPPPEPTLEQAKGAQKEHMRDLRKAAEASGTTWNGHPVGTARRDQAAIALAARAADADGTYTAVWRFEDGTFMELTAAEIQSLADTVRKHVQTAFDTESVKAAEIDTKKAVSTVEAVTWDI